MGIAIDLVTQKLIFTNAVGDLDPYSVGRAISKRTRRNFEPYHFRGPSSCQSFRHGDLKPGRHEDDMHFELVGHRFRWQTYPSSADHRQYRLDRPPPLSDQCPWNFSHAAKSPATRIFIFCLRMVPTSAFNITGADVDLHTFVEQTGLKTNKLEGNSPVNCTSPEVLAKTGEHGWKWQCSSLKDGFIWDIPLLRRFLPC